MFVSAVDPTYADGLVKALKRSFFWRRSGYAVTFGDRAQADIIVYDPNDTDEAMSETAEAVRRDHAAIKIFLERPCPDVDMRRWKEFQRKNRMIREIADTNSGFVVTLMTKFQRWGTAALLKPSGMPTAKGFRLIAEAIAEHVDMQVVRRNLARNTQIIIRPRPVTRRIVEYAANVLMGRAERLHPRLSAFLARIRAPVLGSSLHGGLETQADIRAFLGRFGSEELIMPRNLLGPANIDAVRAFVRREVYFPAHPHWGSVPFDDDGIDWSMPGPNRSWRIYFVSLEFLNPVLGYLVAATRSPEKSRSIAEISDYLKSQDISDAELFHRIGAVVADFIARNPPNNPRTQYAWNEGAVSRRLRNLLAYLACARNLLARDVVLDERRLVEAHANMRALVEFLRSENIYVRSGNHGVRQDALLVSVGLLMKGTDYGVQILRQGLDRLREHQIETGLSSDGVWLENSFGYHCLVLRLLVSLAQDFDTFGVTLEPWLMDAIRRMTFFTAALIKCDEGAPLLGDTKPGSQGGVLHDARQVLKRHDPAQNTSQKCRAALTFHFPDGGYFASYSRRELDNPGSSVVLSATLRNTKHKQADDLSIIFSREAVDLLVDGGTYNKEASDRIRDAARFDPASHNSFRVNHTGYTIGTNWVRRPVTIDKKWDGEGWAACLATSDAYADGKIARLVIHLKNVNAVLVVDRLKSRTRTACPFEQFWHIAPQFSRAGTLQPEQLLYSSRNNGHLMIALDTEEAALAEGFGSEDDPIAWLMTERGKIKPTPYLRREKILREGMMASSFQWSETEPGHTQIAVGPSVGKDFQITASGRGYSAIFAFRQQALVCLSLDEA